MANNYFQFRQFTVFQEHCAMKVCTDACIFGAYVANYCRQLAVPPGKILDIGAGTGLLSLLLAQQSGAAIDAVEIDETAHQQAADNFQQSPWKNQLQIFRADVLHFNPGKLYDAIITNPPFYESDLKSGDKKKDAAKHDTSLTLDQLVTVMDQLLAAHGFFAILLPFHRVDYFIQLAAGFNFHLRQQLLVQHTPSHPYFRGILFFKRQQEQVIREELFIKTMEGNYSSGFIQLMKDYYLHL